MDIMSWLPWTGIIFIDFILGTLYISALCMITIALLILGAFILAFLLITCYIWIPILAIIVIIMKLCGL